MNVKPILLVDSHYICYRAMFTIGNLSFDERPTGVIFGFLNQIIQLATRFDYPRFIFAWDSKRSYRKEIYPNYKRKDQEPTPELLELLEVCRPQFPTIRTQVLPRIGFINNFIQTGLEADDIIAKITQNLYHKEIYIISADSDLFQLLLPTINIYNPQTKKIYGMHNFMNEWKILPGDWPKVKALAGCDSDNIKGIPGVKEKTAIKWLQHRLGGKKVDLIEKQAKRMYEVNLPLVSLPHPKTETVKIFEDEFSFKCFEDLCLEYGFKSFLSKGIYEKWKKLLN